MNKIKEKLNKIEELESQAHKIYDDVSGSLKNSNLNSEQRSKKYKRTYYATAKHSEAMDLLRKVQNDFTEVARNNKKDLEFLTEMQQHLKQGELDYVEQMISDWIKELEEDG